VIALGAAALLPLGCGYQLQFQGTATPTPVGSDGTLHVQQISGPTATSPQQDSAPASLIDQMVQRYLDSAGTGAGDAAATANPTPATAAATPQTAPTPLAAQPTPAAAPSSASDARYAGPAQPPITIPSDTVLPPVTAANVTAPDPTQPPAAASATPQPNAALAARTLTVATPEAQVTSVSLAVTFPTGGQQSQPSQSATATPAPAKTATAAPTPPPPPPAPRQPVVIYLQPGPNDITYVGTTQSVSQALASLAGQYSTVYYTPSGSTQAYVYRPGIDPALTVAAGTWMRIVFTGPAGTRFVMYPAN
jgi:hypothetical protein